MRYRFLLILLLLSLSACTYQVQVLTPEPSVSVDITATQKVVQSTVETFTPTPLPAPTQLSIPPTFTPTALPQVAGNYPIKFGPNGTYFDVVDSILSGTSKTYSINALKGQIMSISIYQGSDGDWVYIPIQITGADGTLLCPQIINVDCIFWRGMLPATQDYFVKLTPVNTVTNFTMRVAINPPGVATQSFQYNSPRQNATFTYLDDFAPARFPSYIAYKVEPEFTLQFIDTSFYTNTNLFEAYLLFGSSNDSSLVADCTQPQLSGGLERVTGEVNINGRKFVRSEAAGVGAGNIYEQIYHRIAFNGYCYEVTFFFHYANIGNYAPDSGVHEFDRAALLQKYAGILATLVLK